MGRAEAAPSSVRVLAGDCWLNGDLEVPAAAPGLVLFAHGSGSSRHSPRNQYVARVLRCRGLGTMLIDLLTEDEEAIDSRTAHLRFDIELLAGRLVAIIDWLGDRRETAALPVGLFGTSTGGGAALMAAAERPARVGAIVSRGGRPDLADSALARVRAPTLLIVGGRDPMVLTLNRTAKERMTAEVVLQIVPGATQLFEEPGTLAQAANLAADHFTRHLSKAATMTHAVRTAS
jgi:pimeloyl-ACP methyl ester carboxylesterase